LSSPVSGQAISPQFSNPTGNVTDDFYKFDEGTYTWINSRSTGNVYNPSFENNFVVGRGYLAAYLADATKTFSGIMNSGSQFININRTYADLLTSGWNLVGNPYPSNIDWDAATGWTKTNSNNAIYVAKSGGWATYVDGVGTNGGSRYISVGQGFFVSAINLGAGSLAMTNNVRVHNSATFFKNAKSQNLVRVEVSGNGYTDETVVRFVPGATVGFDGHYDAMKMFNFNENSTQIYTNSNMPLTINSLNTETNKVDLGVRGRVAGKYSLKVTELNNIDFVTLHDKKTGFYSNLKAKPYTYYFEPGENEIRFELLFKPISETETENPVASIYSYGKTIGVAIKDLEVGDIYIYNVAGQLVASEYKVSGTTEFSITVAGIYLVKVMADKDLVFKKVWVK
ncbi:MAG: T9SS type A sorting domain-containing protein, partial [Bacteroidales bacterium]